MNRRAALKVIGASIAASLIVQATPATAFAEATDVEVLPEDSAGRRPNVLMIVLDDLNDWIGCLGGHPQVETPNMDRLARRGMLFTNAHCSAPLCNPSRVSMLTGMLPTTTGIWNNSQKLRDHQPDAITLPQYFRAYGYRAWGAGKIYHVWNDQMSWDTFFHQPVSAQPRQRPLNGIQELFLFDWGPLDARDPEMADSKTVDWVISQLDQAGSTPFFLAAGISATHMPLYAPQKYFEMYPPEDVEIPSVFDDDLDDVPQPGVAMALDMNRHKTILRYGKWQEIVASYLACITFADTLVGRLISALDRSPYADNTVIILTGDNGWHLGQKQHWEKKTLWEESTHVPLIVVAPGLTEQNQRCARPVSLLDLYPTLLDICELEADPGLEGESLVDLLVDPTNPRERPAITLHGPGYCAARTENWRYICYGADSDDELYDHTDDPHEWTNLAQDPAYRRVKAKLKRWTEPYMDSMQQLDDVSLPIILR